MVCMYICSHVVQSDSQASDIAPVMCVCARDGVTLIYLFVEYYEYSVRIRMQLVVLVLIV